MQKKQKIQIKTESTQDLQDVTSIYFRGRGTCNNLEQWQHCDSCFFVRANTRVFAAMSLKAAAKNRRTALELYLASLHSFNPVPCLNRTSPIKIYQWIQQNKVFGNQALPVLSTSKLKGACHPRPNGTLRCWSLGPPAMKIERRAWHRLELRNTWDNLRGWIPTYCWYMHNLMLFHVTHVYIY